MVVFLAECRQSLGVENGFVGDSQLTSNLFYNLEPPKYGRLNNASCWCSREYVAGSYLQVERLKILIFVDSSLS